MLTQKEFVHIQNTVFSLVNFTFAGQIKLAEFDGVKVEFDGKDAIIGCHDKTTLARALFLLAMKSPKGAFSLEEKPSFRRFGVQIDVARNRVLTVDALKKYMEYLAALGFNEVWLYMEDVFEMENYPRFGYMRGRYSVAELRELDDYAYALGIEIVPTVETLGHMEQYLRWDEAGEVRDTGECLLVGVPETYAFLEEVFKTMRAAFRTERIHLCLDETISLGTGVYKKLFGEKEKTEIIYDHLEKLEPLWKKYGFRPYMYSDMFFRKLSPQGRYYLIEGHITKEMGQRLPADMVLDYWDYYHLEKEHYDRFIEEHRRFERPFKFLGSLWSWEGFIEDTVFSYQTSVPAMLSCIENKIDTVDISMWGDDGAETDISTTVSSLPLYSEMCYKGRECSIEELDEVSGFLTGITFSDKLAISRIHHNFHKDKFFAKRIFYADLMYDLVNASYDYEKVMADFRAVYEYTASCKNNYFAYCNQFAKCVIGKLEVLHRLRSAYLEDDRAWLRQVCSEKLPALVCEYRKFRKIFSDQWLATGKPNGLEITENRMGAAILRMETLIERLEAYLQGKVTSIPELAGEHMISEEPPYTVPALKVMGTSYYA